MLGDPRHKPLRLLLLLAVLSLAALAFALYWFSKDAASFLIRAGAYHYGQTVERLELSAVGPKGLSIRQLVIEDDSYQARIGSAHLGWALPAVFGGQIEELVIEEVYLSLKPPSQSREDSPDEGPKKGIRSVVEQLYPIFRTILTTKLPPGDVTVKHFELSLFQDEVAHTLKGSLSISNGTKLKAEVLFEDQTYSVSIVRVPDKSLELHVSDSKDLQLQLSVESRSALEAYEIAITFVLQTTNDLPVLSLPVRAARVQASVSPLGVLTIAELSGDYLLSRDLHLRANLLEPFSVTSTADRLDLGSQVKFKISDLSLPLAGGRVSLEDIQLLSSAEDLTTPSLFLRALVSLELGNDKKKTSLNLTAEANFIKRTVDALIESATGEFALSGQCSFLTSLQCDRLSLRGALPFVASALALPIEFAAGKATVEGVASHASAGPVGLFKVSVEAAAGKLGEISFSGVDAANVTVGISSGTSPRVDVSSLAPLKVSQIDTGVLISEVTGDVSFQWDGATSHFHLKDLRGSLLGGTFSSPLVSMPIPESSSCNDAVFTLQTLRLAEVAALYGSADLEAEGDLSGTVPFTWCTEGLSVSEAILRASDAGGWIKYRGNGSAVSAPGLDLVFSILENYRFTTLETNVSVGQSGDLLALVTAAGTNPAVNKGQQVSVNLKVEENIPALLKSLRVGNDLSRDVTSKPGGR